MLEVGLIEMKNRILYRCLETKHYLCTIFQNKMGINKLKVVLTEEAQAFLDAQPFKAQQKIYYNIFKVEEGVMKVDIFKKPENTEIWEFRTLYNGICYRLFSFWDTEEETLVIATHGIIKKTQKTPLKEIAKAEEIRKEYFSNNKKITWYKMLSRFAPNDILLEEFKTISFNHVLFYKRDTKMYQVIFFYHY